MAMAGTPPARREARGSSGFIARSSRSRERGAPRVLVDVLDRDGATRASGAATQGEEFKEEARLRGKQRRGWRCVPAARLRAAVRVRGDGVGDVPGGLVRLEGTRDGDHPADVPRGGDVRGGVRAVQVRATPALPSHPSDDSAISPPRRPPRSARRPRGGTPRPPSDATDRSPSVAAGSSASPSMCSPWRTSPSWRCSPPCCRWRAAGFSTREASSAGPR